MFSLDDVSGAGLWPVFPVSGHQSLGRYVILGISFHPVGFSLS